MPQDSICGTFAGITSLRIALILAALSLAGKIFLPFFVNIAQK
jgi:hypothetical protein